MVETEIWPNVITELNRRGIPSVLINGRISDKSFGKYILARPFLSGVLRKISGFAMQSRLDAQRIIRMGAPEDKVAVTGTMKFDIEAKADAASVNDIALKLGLGPSGRLFVAGSTHPGEEEPVLTTYKELVGEYPELKLLIAPRHVERAPEIEKLIVNYGFSPVRLSAPPIPDTRYPKPRVFILDTIGHLTTAYALASVVFIGGSFIMHGGQNPIEPAMMGKAVVFGPYMFNFKEPVRLLLEGKGAAQALYPLYLTGEVRRLLKNPAAALALGDNARRIVAANRGATARNLDIIGGILGRPVKG
jgi:3-deoxy-D-manno-octulosonic-acid transferase